MTLAIGLEACLARIVDDLLGDQGLPGRNGEWVRTDYGTYPYNAVLRSNHGDDAAAVLTFVHDRVHSLTNGEKSVVFAHRKYFEKTTRSGMNLALVPTGEDDSSLNAVYFGIAGASNGVYESLRASAEAIAESEAFEVRSERQSNQSRRGREYAEAMRQRLVRDARKKVRAVLPDDLRQLTHLQREDIVGVLGIYPRDLSALDLADELPDKLEAASLEVLCQMLVILEKEELLAP